MEQDQGQGHQPEESPVAPEESTGITSESENGTAPEQSDSAGSVSEMEALRKQAYHGSRKISQLTTDKSDLTAELQQRDARIQALENQVNMISQQQQTNAEAGYDYDQNQGVDEDYKLYRNATQELANVYGEIKEDVASLKDQNQRRQRIKDLQDNFGLAYEDADAAVQYRDNGDDINFAKVVNLGSAQQQARQQARSQRQEQISAASVVNEGSATPSGTPANVEQQAEDIATGKVNQRDVSKMLAENPDLLDKLSTRFLK